MTGIELFNQCRQRLWNLLYKDLVEEEDCYHKSYEGAIDLIYAYPNFFESHGENYELPEKPERVAIELHCYVLCNGRFDRFEGSDLLEAAQKFSDWLDDREESWND